MAELFGFSIQKSTKDKGGGKTFTSPAPDDGAIDISGGGFLNSIAYGYNKYVIVGGYKTIVTSSDYISWTRTSFEGPGSTNYRDIVYSEDKFVLVGNSGTILTSTDGTSWNSKTSGTSNNLRGIIYKE